MKANTHEAPQLQGLQGPQASRAQGVIKTTQISSGPRGRWRGCCQGGRSELLAWSSGLFHPNEGCAIQQEDPRIQTSYVLKGCLFGGRNILRKKVGLNSSVFMTLERMYGAKNKGFWS